eukprot:225857-Prymnesium_polylepis.1
METAHLLVKFILSDAHAACLGVASQTTPHASLLDSLSRPRELLRSCPVSCDGVTVETSKKKSQQRYSLDS